MVGFRFLLSIMPAALGIALATAPAEAQNLISYVSGFTGIDANPCTLPSAPCQTISGALPKTVPGGEIRCLDSHQDGLITIDKPITIDCDAPSATIIALSAGVAITVNLSEATYPNGVVTLRNMKFQGLLGFAAPGSYGIRVIGGGAAVHVENCTIRGFAQRGIDFRPTSNVDLFLRDTIISNNAGGAIVINPRGAAIVKGSLSNVRLDGNGGSGLTLLVRESGASAAITVENTNVERNSVGLRASGARASIFLSGSTVTHNSTGLQALNGGKIKSFGNNIINANGTNGAPTSTISLQ